MLKIILVYVNDSSEILQNLFLKGKLYLKTMKRSIYNYNLREPHPLFFFLIVYFPKA